MSFVAVAGCCLQYALLALTRLMFAVGFRSVGRVFLSFVVADRSPGYTMGFVFTLWGISVLCGFALLPG
jgi:hypothetical protein